jgi:hypothetical protein
MWSWRMYRMYGVCHARHDRELSHGDHLDGIKSATFVSPNIRGLWHFTSKLASLPTPTPPRPLLAPLSTTRHILPIHLQDSTVNTPKRSQDGQVQEPHGPQPEQEG